MSKRFIAASLVAVTGTLVLAAVGSAGSSKIGYAAARLVVFAARLQGLRQPPGNPRF